MKKLLTIRKLAAFGCLAATALAVSACGGTSGSSDSSSSSSETTTAAATTEQATTEQATTAATTAASTTPAAGGATVKAGKVVFKANCGACHTLKDAGTSGNVGPNLDDLKPNMATVQHQVENGGGGMPAFGGQLKAVQIASVAKYVSSVAGKGGGGSDDNGSESSGLP